MRPALRVSGVEQPRSAPANRAIDHVGGADTFRFNSKERVMARNINPLKFITLLRTWHRF